MLTLLIGLFLNAVAVMLTPVPILAMFIFSDENSMKSRGSALLFSRFFTAILINYAMLYFGLQVASRNATSQSTSQTLTILLAVLFLIFGVVAWRSRPKDGEEVKRPKWFDRISQMSPWLVFFLGVLTTITGVKNLALMASATQQIAQYTQSPAGTFALIVYYNFMGSLILFVVWGLSLFGGEGSQNALKSIRHGIYKYGNVTIAVLMIALALYEFYRAFAT